MELEALDATLAHAGRNPGPVIADRRNDGRILRHCMEAVDEVYVLSVSILQQGGRDSPW